MAHYLKPILSLFIRGPINFGFGPMMITAGIPTRRSLMPRLAIPKTLMTSAWF